MRLKTEYIAEPEIFILRFIIPVDKGKEAEADGSLSIAIKNLVEQIKPEAAYFHLQDGKRAGTVFFEEAAQTRTPLINQPLFAKLNTSIDIQPAIILDELLDKL